MRLILAIKQPYRNRNIFVQGERNEFYLGEAPEIDTPNIHIFRVSTCHCLLAYFLAYSLFRPPWFFCPLHFKVYTHLPTYVSYTWRTTIQYLNWKNKMEKNNCFTFFTAHMKKIFLSSARIFGSTLYIYKTIGLKQLGAIIFRKSL